MFPKLETPSIDIANLQKCFMTNRRYEFQSECIKSVFRESNLKRKRNHIKLKSKMSMFLKYDKYMSGKRTKCPLVTPNSSDSGIASPYSEIMFEVLLFNTLAPSEAWSPPACSQAFTVLGSQSLIELTKIIRCVNSFTDVAGDVSENPDQPSSQTLKDVVTSSLFFFGNNFYIDGVKDYSKVIKEWGERKKLSLGETYPMSTTLFRDLTIRLNYPYLYQHLGDCEHTIIFTEARFVDDSDEKLDRASFPKVKYQEDSMMQKCYICGHFYARWVVQGTDRLVFETNTLCDPCFKKYNYVDGKKVGEFQAYRILLDKK
uniref:snRNA-activating protein complex subunit 3 n=1 Tax=Cacopsylla melanoneura TaxID=428564 RepID=A0A8D8Q597_9HEMI